MSQLLSPAEREAVARISERIADPAARADAHINWVKNTPEGQKAEIDRIAALEVQGVPDFLRGAL